jgi:2-desacetyl-2-hydroxyethyl bacteriochlorophyllide A dehydrogenase
MRQAVMTSPGRIELRSVAEPRPGPGEVLMRIRRIGVCGSDVHVNHGKHPFVDYPVVQGHEFSALVEAVGEGVSGLRPGMKVTATPQIVCGTCRPCRKGRYNVCENLIVRGFRAPGMAQDLQVIEADKIVVLPDSFTEEQGAIVEPVAVASHASARAGDLSGRNVVVLGAGPIGNLVAQGCRKRGAKKVLITDLSDYRLEVARAVGIEASSNAKAESLADAAKLAFGGEGFDIAFEAIGSEAAMGQAITSIDKGGTIVVVGVFGSKPPIDMARVGEHELCMIGSMMYRKDDYETAVAWIADGSVRTEALDSRHFPLERYAEAYRFIDEQGEKAMKIFVDL